jgi:hypothetical protein
VLDENPLPVLLQWWKDIGRVKPKYSEENLFNCFVYHILYVDRTAMETVSTAVGIGD